MKDIQRPCLYSWKVYAQTNCDNLKNYEYQILFTAFPSLPQWLSQTLMVFISEGEGFNKSTMKETFYFSHDYNSRNDPKLQKLLMKCDTWGIGIYWCLIEMLYEQNGYLKISECESYAFALHTDSERIARVVNEFDLFVIKGDLFFSESVLRRLQERDEKSKKARKSALKRWELIDEENANAMRTQCDGNAIKERKGKEKKEKEIQYKSDSNEYRLAELLINLICGNNPTHKFLTLENGELEKKIQAYAKEVDLMFRVDSRTYEQIEFLIKWSQNDSFWKANILSMSKLREKFDQLVVQCKRKITEGKPQESKTAYIS